jgi:predicted nucleotidyltransferase
VGPSDSQWPIYSRVIQEARARGIEFALGGGLAVEAYTIHRQSTKDIDLYVLPGDREAMVEVVTQCGLVDLYDKQPYDRKWIYRSHVDDTIVDIMWAMPNQRAHVDPRWLTRGREVDLHGYRLRVLPPEELIWAKLYVMQRDRCDWPDVLNLIYATAPELDWDHLYCRLGDDAPLLEAVLTIFEWLCPQRAAHLPSHTLQRLKSGPNGNCIGKPRADLLDTRPWFIPALELAHQEN